MEFVSTKELSVLNTWFQKDVKKLCTHKHHGINAEESDWTFNTFDQFDYILVNQRWKNACTNTENDYKCVLGSDHMPVIAYLRIHFKRPLKKNNDAGMKDLEVDEEMKDDFNAKIEQHFEYCERNDMVLEGIEVWDQALSFAADEVLVDKIAKPKKPWVSAETLTHIKIKHEFDRKGDSENFKIKETEVKKNAKTRLE